MNLGKILLLVFIIFFSAAGYTLMQDFAKEENPPSSVDDYSPQNKMITIKVTDGIGSKDKG